MYYCGMFYLGNQYWGNILLLVKFWVVNFVRIENVIIVRVIKDEDFIFKSNCCCEQLLFIYRLDDVLGICEKEKGKKEGNFFNVLFIKDIVYYNVQKLLKFLIFFQVVVFNNFKIIWRCVCERCLKVIDGICIIFYCYQIVFCFGN